MNERLFDALPSMIHDEMISEEKKGDYNFEDLLPKPFKPQSLKVGGTTFVDGMRVRAGAWFCLDCEKIAEDGSCSHCKFSVDDNTYGHVHVGNQQLIVSWEKG